MELGGGARLPGLCFWCCDDLERKQTRWAIVEPTWMKRYSWDNERDSERTAKRPANGTRRTGSTNVIYILLGFWFYGLSDEEYTLWSSYRKPGCYRSSKPGNSRATACHIFVCFLLTCMFPDAGDLSTLLSGRPYCIEIGTLNFHLLHAVLQVARLG